MNELEKLGLLTIVYLISAAVTGFFLWSRGEDPLGNEENRKLIVYPILNTLTVATIIFIIAIDIKKLIWKRKN